MHVWLDGIMLFAAALLLGPAIWILVSCVVASLPRRAPQMPGTGPHPSIAVLIPAHNEAAVLQHTLDAVLRQVQPGDRILVVADNCSDDTAKVAAKAGAEVIERYDAERRGKGFALDFGMRYLAANAPRIILVLDADCDIGPGTLDILAREAERYGGPVQAAYYLYPPPKPKMRDHVSSLAFTMKGAARAYGLARMGFPCLLEGTGMAVPWNQMRDASLATGNIVEDMQLGVDLALAGHLPRYCPDGVVSGQLPQSGNASISQRTRWEHGHLETILRQVPRLIGAALRQRSPKLLGLAMELAIPPLAFYALMVVASLGVFGFAAWHGFSIEPLGLAFLASVLISVAVLLSWWRFARKFVPIRALLGIPLYAISKIPIYLWFVVRRQRDWVRTERSVVR